MDVRTVSFDGPLELGLVRMLPQVHGWVAAAAHVAQLAYVTRADWTEVVWRGVTEVLGRPLFRARATSDPSKAWGWLEAPPELRQRVTELTAVVRGEHPDLLAEVQRLLMADPSLDAVAVAGALRRSGRSLQRDLAARGETFAGLRARTRIALAEAWLRSSDAKVETIARAVGFGSVTHFTAWFCRATGLTPSAWRGALRGLPGVHQP